jgi:hypothetical protein
VKVIPTDDQEEYDEDDPDFEEPAVPPVESELDGDQLPSYILNLFEPKIARYPWQGKLFARDLGYTVEPNTREQVWEVYETLSCMYLTRGFTPEYILDDLMNDVHAESKNIGRPLTEKELRWLMLDDGDDNLDWPRETPWWYIHKR